MRKTSNCFCCVTSSRLCAARLRGLSWRSFDRAVLAAVTARLPRQSHAVLLVTPRTLLRWHQFAGCSWRVRGVSVMTPFWRALRNSSVACSKRWKVRSALTHASG
jgi:hypothetical protein